MVATALYFVATMRGVRKVEVVWVADANANAPFAFGEREYVYGQSFVS